MLFISGLAVLRILWDIGYVAFTRTLSNFRDDHPGAWYHFILIILIFKGCSSYFLAFNSLFTTFCLFNITICTISLIIKSK